MSDARAPEIGLHAFAGRVACVVLALTALMAWRLIIGVATLDIDAATMKLTQRFTGAPMKRAETRAVVTTMTLDAPTSSEPRRARREVKERDAFARGAAAPPSDAPSDDAPSDDAPRATMDDLERLRASLRRIQGVEEDVDFIESLERDANSKSNPCWTAKDGATRCLPAAYVMGAWQSGGEELGERLQRALGRENVVARAPHFWNEHTETLERYASMWDRDAFGVDASPGTLAMSWSESIRFHRAHGARVEKCWKACQELSNTY